jgi:hypothetical protein
MVCAIIRRGKNKRKEQRVKIVGEDGDGAGSSIATSQDAKD